MVRFFKTLPALAAVSVLLSTSAPARASIAIELQEGSGTVVRIDGTTGVSFNGQLTTSGQVSSGGDITIGTVLAGLQFGGSLGTSNSPGTSANALTQLGNFIITNNTSDTLVLHINVSATGFTAPQSPPPLDLSATVSGSGVNGSVSGTFQGYADASNTLFGRGFAAPQLTFAVSGDSNQSWSQNGDSGGGFSPGGATYSLSLFETLTLGARASITLTGGSVQTTPTPAPAGLVLAFTAAPVLGLGYWFRRRRLSAADHLAA